MYVYIYICICCDTFGVRKPCVSITVYVCMYVCMYTSVCLCVSGTAQARSAPETLCCLKLSWINTLCCLNVSWINNMFTYTVEACTYIYIYMYMYVCTCCDTFGVRKPCVSIYDCVCLYVCVYVYKRMYVCLRHCSSNECFRNLLLP